MYWLTIERFGNGSVGADYVKQVYTRPWNRTKKIGIHGKMNPPQGLLTRPINHIPSRGYFSKKVRFLQANNRPFAHENYGLFLAVVLPDILAFAGRYRTRMAGSNKTAVCRVGI